VLDCIGEQRWVSVSTFDFHGEISLPSGVSCCHAAAHGARQQAVKNSYSTGAISALLARNFYVETAFGIGRLSTSRQ
jgi:hypothetical protein